MNKTRIDLSQDDIPKKWYNILPDLPGSLPPYKDAENDKEIRNLPEIYSKTASNLEFSNEQWVDIPIAVLNAYIQCGRPRPLIRAKKLEDFLQTPARIYYKCEDLPPGGTFKTNTALPQAYWAMKEGYKRTIIRGSSRTRTKFIHVFAAKKFGLVPTVFSPRADCKNNSDMVFFLKTMLEADLIESPSNRTETGRKILKTNKYNPGSMSIVREEIIEEVKNNKDAVIVISSLLNHVLMTQTIIGLEVEKQLESIDETPNILIAPVGGGSNFYGLTAPFIKKYLKKKLWDVKFLAVESETSAKLTYGKYEYTPCASGLLVKTYEFYRDTPPPSIIGSGIQTKNTAPLLSFLNRLGLIQTVVYSKDEREIFEAARIFLQTEGYLLAPESAYTVRATIDEASKAKKIGEEKVIVMSLSGTSYLDFGEKTRYMNIPI